MKNNKIFTIHVDPIVHSNPAEYDIDLKEDLGYDYNAFDDYQILYGKTFANNGAFMPIEHMQTLIDEYKAKGVTHLNIDTDVDHYGYYFTGLKIYREDKVKQYTDKILYNLVKHIFEEEIKLEGILISRHQQFMLDVFIVETKDKFNLKIVKYFNKMGETFYHKHNVQTIHIPVENMTGHAAIQHVYELINDKLSTHN
jgi:hypothetical protein